MSNSGNTISREKTVAINANINDPKLAGLIETHFDLAELLTLMHDLGYNKDNIEPGGNLQVRVRALVAKCRRENRLADLWQLCKQTVPGADWESALEEPESPPAGDLVKKSKRSLWLVVGVLIVVLFVGGVVGWLVGNGRDGRDETVDTAAAQAGFAIGVDYAPAEIIYDFENCSEALNQWNLVTDDQNSLACSSKYAYRGLNSLSVPVNIYKRENENSPLGTTQVWLQSDTLNNKLLVMRIFILPDAPTTMAAHLLVQDAASAVHFGPLTQLRPGAWNNLVWSLSEYEESITALGVEFKLEGQDISSDESQYSGMAYIDTVEIYPLPTTFISVVEASSLTPVNVKERYDFETAVDTDPLAGWGLDTCPTLDTSQCGWINADNELSSVQSGFSGQNSLQVSATLANADQIYSTEYCFDPTLLDGISANVYIPARETNRQALAATKIYLLARPQGDVNSQKQWPTSALDLEGFTQPGWYQVSLDLSQVADESRRPYNTQLVDCVHIDLILPAVAQNEQANFLIDDVTLYRTTSKHEIEGSIPPLDMIAGGNVITAPYGVGNIFDFEDGVLNTDIWSASDAEGGKELSISSKEAYSGFYSVEFHPYLKERTGNSGGSTFCITLDAPDYSLQQKIVVGRVYIPKKVPEILGAQIYLTGYDGGRGFWPSWPGNAIKHGQWNTLVWYTADNPEEWQDGLGLNFCLFLYDRGLDDDKIEYPSEEYEDSAFYLDSVEIIPYDFVHLGYRTLDPVAFYDFVSDKVPDMVIDPPTPPLLSSASGVVLQNDDFEILALQLDVDLLPNPTGNITNDERIMQVNFDEERIEAVMTMVNFPGESGTSVFITMEGNLINGNVISQTFPVSAGKWTPLFWPIRGNDFDSSDTTEKMERISIYLSSPINYEGAIYFDYLGLYRRLPKQD